MGEYLQRTRSMIAGFMFVLPLMLAYEVGVILFKPDTQSAAAGGVWRLVSWIGPHAATVFIGIMIGYLAASYGQIGNAVSFGLFMGVVGESAIYAMVLGPVIAKVSVGLMNLSVPALQDSAQNLLLAVGAGIYEELIFRLLLVGGIFFILTELVGAGAAISGLVAVLVGSVFFSLFHFSWTGSENFDWYRFVFRFIAGVVLSAIFMLRGIAIAIYAHVFYDLIVLFKWLG